MARPDVALPGDRRVVVVLLVLGVLLSGPAVAGATPRGASSWHVEASSAVPPGDPVLDGGRVWWLTVPTGTSTTATLRSRSVGDRHARAVPLPLPAPFDPADDRQLPAPPVLSVGAGLAAAQLSWWSGNDPGVATRTEPSYVAAFDARSGTLLAAVRFRQSAATLVPGSDLVTAPVGPDPTDGTFGTFPVLDPAGTVAVRPDQVAGPYALTYSGFRPEGRGVDYRDAQVLYGDASHRGWVRATVSLRATGRRIYSVTARALGRAAVPDHPDGQADVARLLPDGSLAVVATRRGIGADTRRIPSTLRGRDGIRPVRVDRAGRIRRLGRPVDQAVYVGGLYAGGRGLVLIDDRYTTRSCSRLVLVDRRGDRGRRLGAPSARRTFPPVAWTGDVAVWPAPHAAFTVDRGLRSPALTRAGRPACRTT